MFFQVILLFDEVYLIKFPDVYLEIINVFSFLSFDWFQVAQLDCVTQVPLLSKVAMSQIVLVLGATSDSRFASHVLLQERFVSKLYLSTLVPIGLSCILGIIYISSLCKYGRRSRAHKVISNTVMNVFLILTYLLFPVVSAVVFSAFVCERFDDGSFLLRADYTIDCNSEKYKEIRAFAAIMIFVYPVVRAPCFVCARMAGSLF